LNATYFIGTWSVFGASPGQRLMGVRIGAEADGGELSVGQTTVRLDPIRGSIRRGRRAQHCTIGRAQRDCGPSVVCLVWLLLVTTGRSPTKQGLHDRVARTIFVKEARRVPWDQPGVGR
jgi:uncharacterized RDD family membrane protein YckC